MSPENRERLVLALCLSSSILLALVVTPLLLPGTGSNAEVTASWTIGVLVWFILTVRHRAVFLQGFTNPGDAVEMVARAIFYAAGINGLFIAMITVFEGLGSSEAMARAVVHYLLMILPVPLFQQGVRSLPWISQRGDEDSRTQLKLAQRWVYAMQIPLLVGTAGMVIIQTRFVATTPKNHEAESGFEAQELASAMGADGTVLRALLEPHTGWISLELEYTLFGIAALILVLASAYGIGHFLVREVVRDLDVLRRALDQFMKGLVPAKDTLAVSFAEGQDVLHGLHRAWTELLEEEAALGRAEQLGAQAAREKSRVLAHVAHELKNPLNAMLGFTEMNLAELNGPLTVKEREALSRVWETCDQMLRFIIALLELTRVEGLSTPETSTDSENAEALGLSGSTLLAHLEDIIRKHPLALKVITTRGDLSTDDLPWVRADCSVTARILHLLAWMVLDEMGAGRVELVVKDDVAAITIQLQVLDAQGDQCPDDHDAMPEAPQVTVSHLSIYERLMSGLAEVQGGVFQVDDDRWSQGWKYVLPRPTAMPDGP